MEALRQILGPGELDDSEARASLRSHADTLHELDYERDILRIEVGKTLAERDDALEKNKSLEQTLLVESLRQPEEEAAERSRNELERERDRLKSELHSAQEEYRFVD
ncbi:hypothetical protein FOMPIDRAFT_1016656 [Fomitopsis schrenkii]|uniref:Uncharacterized protein n=1 Tax=Fomitopsis schrenkii TaxID=2126942 RepID=S8E625_FOMSC|nr:hypothetical protein FOMPIDRAFT_1016656 [Fomitopsis schrenkii]